MEKVTIIIDGKEARVDKNFTVLQATKSLGIEVPTICNDDRLVPYGACRMCVVEVKNARALLTACTTPVAEGMEINTHSERAINARKTTLELMIANHPLDCLTCSKAGNCKLQDYCFEYEVTGEKFKGFKKAELTIDDSNDFYTFDQNKCILCGKCSKKMVKEIENYISSNKRNIYSLISTMNTVYIDEKIARKFSPDWKMFKNLNTKRDLYEYINSYEYEAL